MLKHLDLNLKNKIAIVKTSALDGDSSPKKLNLVGGNSHEKIV